MGIKTKVSAGLVAGGIVCAAAVAGLVFSAASCLSTLSTYSATMGDLESQVSSQQAKLDALADAAVVTVDEAAASAKSATEQGNEVAELQNAYIGATGDTIASTAQSLSPYFDVDSQKGRTPWFSYTASDGQGHAVKWSFGTVTGVDSDDVADLDVIWVCRYEGTSTVLAYVTATYNTSDETFSSVDVHLTSAGTAASSASSLENSDAQGSDASDSSTSDIDSIVEKLRGVDPSSVNSTDGGAAVASE